MELRDVLNKFPSSVCFILLQLVFYRVVLNTEHGIISVCGLIQCSQGKGFQNCNYDFYNCNYELISSTEKLSLFL